MRNRRKAYIVKLLAHRNIDKRLEGMQMLLELEEKERIPLLLRIIEDKSWRLRELAAKELSQFGSRVVPRLLKVAKSSLWYARSASCFALGEIGDVRALETLVELIKNDDNPTVLKEATLALGKVLLKNLPFVKDRLEESFWSRFTDLLNGFDRNLYQEVVKKE